MSPPHYLKTENQTKHTVNLSTIMDVKCVCVCLFTAVITYYFGYIAPHFSTNFHAFLVLVIGFPTAYQFHPPHWMITLSFWGLVSRVARSLPRCSRRPPQIRWWWWLSVFSLTQAVESTLLSILLPCCLMRICGVEFCKRLLCYDIAPFEMKHSGFSWITALARTRAKGQKLHRGFYKWDPSRG